MPEPEGFEPETWEVDWAELERHMAGGGCVFVAEDGGELVGLPRRAMPPRRGAGTSRRCTSAPPHRRQGIAKALLRACAGAARAAGATHVSLEVLTTNELAEGVWRRLGFEPVELADGAVARRARPAPRRCAGRPFARLDPRSDRRPRLGRAGGRAVRAAARDVRRPRRRRAAGSGSSTRSSTPIATPTPASPATCPTGSAPSSSRSRSRSAPSCAAASTSAAAWSTSTSPSRATTRRSTRATSSRSPSNPTLVARLTGADREEVRRVARTAAVAGRPAAGGGALPRAGAGDGARGRRLRLVDAARCPFCARVRLALAEKGDRLRDGRDRPRQPTGLALRAEPGRQGAGARRRVRRSRSRR